MVILRLLEHVQRIILECVVVKFICSATKDLDSRRKSVTANPKVVPTITQSGTVLSAKWYSALPKVVQVFLD